MCRSLDHCIPLDDVTSLQSGFVVFVGMGIPATIVKGVEVAVSSCIMKCEELPTKHPRSLLGSYYGSLRVR